MAKPLRNVHPGEVLRYDFIGAMGLTQAGLARAIGVPASTISDIANCRRSISAEIDLRLCRYFGLTEGYWLRLQDSYDILDARRKLGVELDRITPRAA